MPLLVYAALEPPAFTRRTCLAGAAGMSAVTMLPVSATVTPSPSAAASAMTDAWKKGPADAEVKRTSVFVVMPERQAEPTIVTRMSTASRQSQSDVLKQSLVKVKPETALTALGVSPNAGSDTGRALFLGEHHDSAQDHVLQAALITQLRASHPQPMPLAVGLEAVQRKFQPALDAFCNGQLSVLELRAATEWDARWSWPFERYIPVLMAAKEAGATLLALNVDSEDLAAVQKGGFPGLGKDRLQLYIRSPNDFAAFSRTNAFKEYVAMLIRPSYEIHKQYGLLRKTRTGETLPEEFSFPNFMSSRLLSDESMGWRTASWLQKNPGGLAVSLVGNDHIKFGCGAAARCGLALGGIEHVRTVLLNPTNSETAYKNYFSPMLPLTELQLRYAERPATGGPPTALASMEDWQQANAMAQAREGSRVLPISDFLWFSKALSTEDVLVGAGALLAKSAVSA